VDQSPPTQSPDPAWKQEEVGDLTLRTYPCPEEDGWVQVLLDPPD
jgi:hypothetical protein